MKSELRVIPGAPFPPDEAARLEELQSFSILDTPKEAEFDGLVELAAQICGTPVAALSLIDAQRQWFKASVGLSVDETPREESVCTYTILGSSPFVVPNLKDDPRFCNLPMVTGDLSLRYYAGCPVLSRLGHAVGSLCVASDQPIELSPDQVRFLETLGRQASALLELHRSRQTLRRQGEQLEEADRKRHQFLAELGREVRTSMTGIIGLAELMATSPLSAREREYAATIAKSGRAVMSAVGEAIENLPKGQNLLSEAIANCFVLLRPSALARNLRLTYEVAPTLDLSVEVDTRNFRREITRRLEVLFGAQGGSYVHSHFSEQAGKIVVELRCDGRLLGSSLGSDWSVTPNGTFCRFTVNRAVRDDLLRVLVVEDNDVNNLILSSMLSDLGCQVTSVTSAKGALDQLQREPYSLVMTDIQMPEMDGLTMTRAIRAREGERHTPVIAVTASSLAEDHRYYRECGIDDTVQKPFSERDIADVIARWRHLA